jgi:hypothetical protein
MGGCLILIRDLLFTWLVGRIGLVRLAGCGCILFLALAICVFMLVNGALQSVF